MCTGEICTAAERDRYERSVIFLFLVEILKGAEFLKVAYIQIKLNFMIIRSSR